MTEQAVQTKRVGRPPVALDQRKPKNGRTTVAIADLERMRLAAADSAKLAKRIEHLEATAAKDGQEIEWLTVSLNEATRKLDECEDALRREQENQVSVVDHKALWAKEVLPDLFEIIGLQQLQLLSLERQR